MPTEKVSDGKSPKESAEDFWRHLIALGGEHLKSLLQPQHGHTPADIGHPPEIPPEGECWQAFDDMAAKHIKDTAEMLRNQLDNILLFATLFSAINSAFLIYTLPTATTSAQDPTNQLLLFVIQGVSNQSFADASRFLATSESSGHTVNIVVNIIFSVSFVLSIIATLTAVLGQTWVTTYGRDVAVDPKELRDERQRKLCGADEWYFQPVLEIVLPIMLQVALIVFCVGFIVLLWSINTTLGKAVLPFLALGFLAIVASAGAALWDPGCPYQTPISSRVIPKLFSYAYPLWHYVFAVVICFILRVLRLLCPAQSRTSTRRRGDEESLGTSSASSPSSSSSSSSSTDSDKSNGYHEERRELAAKLRRPSSSPGTRHAELVSWALRHSSDSAAVVKVISTLLHGGQAYALTIGGDVYRHPVFDQLLAGAWKSVDSRESHSQRPVWKASLRAIWHIFLAPSVALVPDALHRNRFESLLELEVAIIGANPYSLLGDMGRFEDVLELAACFKLLKFLSSDLSEADLRSHSHFANLLQRVEGVIYCSSIDQVLAFHRLHYLGELVGTLTGRIGGSAPINQSFQPLNTIFDLYNGLRQDCEPFWNKMQSRPALGRAHCIGLTNIMQDASTLIRKGPTTSLLQTSCCRWYFEILNSLEKPYLSDRTIEWDLIRVQLHEVRLLLEALPEGEGAVLSVQPVEGWESPLQDVSFNCTQSISVSRIQSHCLSLTKQLLDAGTLTPASKENRQKVELIDDVAFQLLKIIDLVPKKDPETMLSISFTFFRTLAELNFSSLDWDNIPVIFGLCRATTEWAKIDERGQKLEAKKLEDLDKMAVDVTRRMLEIMSDHGYGRPNEGPTTGMFGRLFRRFRLFPLGTGIEGSEDKPSIIDMIPYLTDFLQRVEVDGLTKGQWTVLENLEWNLEHEKYEDKPARAAARTEYFNQMRVAREKREQSNEPLDHSNTLVNAPQEEIVVPQEPSEAEASRSSMNQHGSGKERVVEQPEALTHGDDMKV